MFIRKFRILNAIYLLMLITLVSCHERPVPETEEARIIIKKWIPDRREALFSFDPVFSGDRVILKGETNVPGAKDEVISLFRSRGANFTDSIRVLPDTLVNRDYFGIVNLSVINLRKEPDHAAELVSQAVMGTPVVILKEENSWMLIQTPDKYLSWTENSPVTRLSREQFDNARHLERFIYVKRSGWIYTSTDSDDVTGDIVAGCIVEKMEGQGGFVRIRMPDGREGFISSEDIMSIDAWKNRNLNRTGADICTTARSYMGIPYLWGGSSIKGADCSGFVQSVYFQNGIVLPRDASLQAVHGKSVDISQGTGNLEPGDLLFFGYHENGHVHVYHVAIYTGNDNFIHASGRVMINSLDSLDSNYDAGRKNSLVSARRILGVMDDPGITRVSDHEWY